VFGQTIVIEARCTAGALERTHQFARDFVDRVSQWSWSGA
jgi:hypothetical protein